MYLQITSPERVTLVMVISLETGDWGTRRQGDKGDKGDKGTRGSTGKANNSFFPITNAQCLMPNAQCPMPNAQCPMPNAQLQNLAVAHSLDRLS
ncbi:hypothetical protein [Tolypothrix sp. VBCCA 56010]|uniref:hypothetical protein n=1 Tax=Tolypothrix sp. VBCCA 56010 TaxID=3137731 RepID=UPI003D7E09B8